MAESGEVDAVDLAPFLSQQRADLGHRLLHAEALGQPQPAQCFVAILRHLVTLGIEQAQRVLGEPEIAGDGLVECNGTLRIARDP